jgi:hypothetical protein
MNRLTFIVVFFLIGYCSSCSNGGSITGGTDNDSSLPKNPSKLTVNWSEGGGMLNRSEHIYISFDSAAWVFDRYNNETVISWKPEKKVIDDLYEVFRSNKIDKIKSTSEGQVFDRGGISINIEIDEKSYEIDNSGSNFIMDKWRSNYVAVNKAITDYAMKEVENQKISIEISLLDGIYKSGYYINLDINEERVINYETDTTSSTVSVKAYPGINQFNFQLLYKDSTNYYGSSVMFKSDMLFEEIYEDGITIKFDMINNIIDIQETEEN